MGTRGAALTVGQVADELGVTVRTLHHYDEIGLLSPSERSRAGYRLYSEADIERLQHVVVYRRLGFGLDEIAKLIDATGADLEDHLRRQRAAVMSRLDEMHDLVKAIDRALEQEMSGIKLTTEEQRKLFGESYSEDYAQEAEERWGDSEGWKQSQQRTSGYSIQYCAALVEVTPKFHRNLGDMYVADPRFARTYEDQEPGLAQYVRDAIHANADRQ